MDSLGYSGHGIGLGVYRSTAPTMAKHVVTGIILPGGATARAWLVSGGDQVWLGSETWSRLGGTGEGCSLVGTNDVLRTGRDRWWFSRSPIAAFILPVSPWPRFSIVSLCDLTIHGLICRESIDEQVYGNIFCAFVMKVDTLTLNTWAKILSDLCKSRG